MATVIEARKIKIITHEATTAEATANQADVDCNISGDDLDPEITDSIVRVLSSGAPNEAGLTITNNQGSNGVVRVAVTSLSAGDIISIIAVY